jgi:hypothetical protein
MRAAFWFVAAGVLVLAVSVQGNPGCCEIGNECRDRVNKVFNGDDVVTFDPSFPDEFGKLCVNKYKGKFTFESGVVTLCAAGQNGAKRCADVVSNVVDDPHFTGFGHEKYDFMGEAGHAYNIFSEATTQINSEMIKLDVPGEDGTYLGRTAVVHTGNGKTDRISIRPVQGSEVAVEVNGVEVVPESGKLVDRELASGARLQLLSSQAGIIDIVRVSMKTLVADFVGTGHHLDIVVEKVAGGLCKVHGVLGQTYKGREWRNGEVSEAERRIALAKKFTVDVIDHEMRDYEVSSLFATDDRFSTFGQEVVCDTIKQMPQAVVARKVLSIEEGSSINCAGAFSTNALNLCSRLRSL